jgi:hypothetical protein
MTKELILSNGKIALVDDEDFEKVSKHNWYFLKGYAAKSGTIAEGKHTVLLHHFVTETDYKYVVDHINGNSLDNQKKNLRVVTAQQNAFNRAVAKNKESSRYKGVHWSKEKNLWLSIIKLNRKPTHLGYFNSEIDAAIAYNENAKNLFGKYARLNDVPENKEWWVKRVFIRQNSSGFRGVTEQKPGRWQARITVDKKRVSIGYYNSSIEAAKAYNRAAIFYHGERALLNTI